ncbi:hypothetical protein [Kitasatospora sp. NPDC090091]|uniref:hypothetical protein n=1 Tax=Kitasatospora sp. NPDC090091 TaxID=3364081 RepID=UPI0038082DED
MRCHGGRRRCLRCDRYLDLLVGAWQAAGRPAQDERDECPRAGYTRTPDGYGLSAVQSLNGHLGLGGSTASFWWDGQDGPDGSSLLPSRIEL